MNNFVYEEWNQEEISEFEALGSIFNINIESKKQDVKKKIAQENMAIIEEKANNELEAEEFIDLHFRAQTTGLQFLSDLLFSADYYVMPTVLRDVGLSYIAYGSTNKIMIYEIGALAKINRQYIIAYKDIKKYKYRVKKNYTSIHLKVEKDKYDQLRESSNWLLYGYLHNRINININSPERGKIIQYLDHKIN